ncbi:hypothetical protein MUK42_36320 [Musa troglodytarum]|uniref:MYB transcription factor n=1 Tax=Musa troglodytarum TaxID=320322 RepID=A0A9E7GC23_9LILI|nr:hypothetical protein MUK42_36320 [Musa troglodytarum]
MQQELQAQMDQLPQAGNQARQLHRARGEAHRPPPSSPWKQVRDHPCGRVGDCCFSGAVPQGERSLIHCRWAAIASYLPERTDNDIKNHWNTHLKKKLRRAAPDHLAANLNKDGFSIHQPVSKGQWEKKLQTDINVAKQALDEALSLKEPRSPGGFGSPVPSTTSYASSTENISRLLGEWMKNPPKKRTVGTEPATVADGSDHYNKTTVLAEKLNSLLSDFESSASMVSESEHLPLLETWLFDESLAQANAALVEMPLDYTAELF